MSKQKGDVDPDEFYVLGGDLNQSMYNRFDETGKMSNKNNLDGTGGTFI